MRIPLLLLLFSSFAIAQTTVNPMEAAKKQALEQHKNILLVFSGSDWCAPCMKLKKEILDTEVFKSEAEKSWVIVTADFPKKKASQLPEDIKKSNEALAEKYNPDGFFPFVVVLDANGKVLGKTGYQKITPEKYIDLLHAFETKI